MHLFNKAPSSKAVVSTLMRIYKVVHYRQNFQTYLFTRSMLIIVF